MMSFHVLMQAKGLEYSLSKLQKQTRDSKEVQDLRMTLQDLPIRVSAAGFFKIHRGLLIPVKYTHIRSEKCNIIIASLPSSLT